MVIFLWLWPFLLFSANSPELNLSPIVKPAPPFYPGQKFVLGYEISFKGFVALTKEELPFLQGAGLEKIGEPFSETEEAQGISKQRFLQYFKASGPGSYSFPASILEGIPYTNAKKPLSEKLHAELKPFTLNILPFPETKPASFNGALGVYTIEATPPKFDTLRVNEPFSLNVTIKGEGEIDTVSFPNLLCQKGWGGFFSLEVPPKLIEKGVGSKTYTLTILPLSDEVQSIPSIAFSFFDLKNKAFQEVSTSSFPVVIREGILPEIKQDVVETPFRLTPLSLIPTGLIALIFFFYRSPLSLIALLPLLINALILIFQQNP